ncbi:MAG TPA: DUF1003 domain-containing protein [Solirubrobacteraceae bacterium]|nr:DUF1003 domain-containing protein [Solirubrobacteraceae bacterium]
MSHSAFGSDRFGQLAERAARFFGTPRYIIGQSLAVVAWVILNSLAITGAIAWDRYPFIALNLAFSLQAAYAAPLILLAQTRQADRDKAGAEREAAHSEAMAKAHTRLLAQIDDRLDLDTAGGLADLKDYIDKRLGGDGQPDQPR